MIASALVLADEDSVEVLGAALKTNWEPWYPYQYQKKETGGTALTGLDIQLVEELAKATHEQVDFQPMPFAQALLALKNGTLDFVSGATYSKEREEYGYYSKPYRFEEDALFVLRKKSSAYSFNNAAELRDYLQKNKFRLGVKKGVIYADEMMNAFIQDPKNARSIVYSEDNIDNLNKLLLNEIDGFLSDRIVGSALVFEEKKES